MKQLMDLSPRSLVLTTALTLLLTPSVSHAQARVDCSRRISPAAGFSAGRSLDLYLGLSQRVVDSRPERPGPTGGGLYLAGRLDLPIAGAWRGRVEVSGANWPLELRRHGNDGEVVARDTVGQIEARQIVASIGRQGGRAPCGYVLAGGGLYSFAIERTPVRHRGAALTAGTEFPISGRDFVQLEGQLHMISLAGHPPVNEGVIAFYISVGWSHRF